MYDNMREDINTVTQKVAIIKTFQKPQDRSGDISFLDTEQQEYKLFLPALAMTNPEDVHPEEQAASQNVDQDRDQENGTQTIESAMDAQDQSDLEHPEDEIQIQNTGNTVSSTLAKTQPPEIPVPVVLPAAQPATTPQSKKGVKAGKRSQGNNPETVVAQMLRERCKQMCISLFFREQNPIHSLGFTSSLRGEGKTFMTAVAANVLAKDCGSPVTLLECNWENPTIHKHFGLASTPGLAEWLRGECDEADIRQQMNDNLTVITAGDDRGEAVKLLQQLRRKGLFNTLSHSNELLVVDLPSIVVSGYGALAAGLVESLIVVVRAGVTPNAMVAETCEQLKDLPVYGLLLNQLESRIPRWIRQLL